MLFPKVYLAGPMIFEADPERYFRVMKDICRGHGLEGIGPLDNQLQLNGVTSGDALNMRIYHADCELMESCDAGVFCLDAFRETPEMDPGTAFEVGYMRALDKPINGWTQQPTTYPDKVATFSQALWGKPLIEDEAEGHGGAKSGLMRDKNGVMVHSQGCVQNLMIEMAIVSAGGHVHAHKDWMHAFERATAELAQILAGRQSQIPTHK
jgi:nucleoside 2-deoxyribosyltransferase